ncbi:hypothetical protein ACLOJK_014154 [Asimina triloba]
MEAEVKARSEKNREGDDKAAQPEGREERGRQDTGNGGDRWRQGRTGRREMEAKAGRPKAGRSREGRSSREVAVESREEQKRELEHGGRPSREGAARWKRGAGKGKTGKQGRDEAALPKTLLLLGLKVEIQIQICDNI